MHRHPSSFVAAAILALEALGIIVLAGWQVAAIAAGDTMSSATAIALVVLTLIGASAVAAFAAAVWRGQSWGRSGGIVTQAMILAIAIGAATGSYASPAVALGLALPAVAALVALVRTVRRAAPASPEASDGSESGESRSDD